MLCSNVLHNLSWQVAGSITPCNNLQEFPPSLSVEEMYSSDAYQQLLADHKANKQSLWCQHCWDKESIGLTSKRISDNKIGVVYERINPNYLKVDAAIGAVCNAACRTCGPSNSTLWQKENNYIPIHPITKDSVWNIIDNRLLDIVQLDFGGGEPWLNDIEKQIEMCQKLVDLKLSKGIKLRYNTNCSLYPKKLIELFPYFRSVELTLSIDDIEDRFEYTRYPLKWNKVYKNIFRLIKLEEAHSNIVLTVNFTVSVLTFLYAEQFLSWSQSHGLPKVNWNFVYYPNLYSIMSIDSKVKEQLPPTALFYDLIATENYPEWQQDFLTTTDKLDKQRRQSMETVLPELYALLT
jgi:hypothetical protein